MNKQQNADSALNQFKNITPIQQIEIVAGAVDAILANLSTIDAGRKSITKAEGSQLTVLKNALKDYPEPMTEEAWDKVFKANVAARLAEARVDGSPRYANSASRDVMVNLIKVATMGLTLARHDRTFEPSYQASTNLKKYASEVRRKLQETIDPATGKARLRTIVTAPRPPKRLSGDTYYWLIGCEEPDKGLGGANAVLGASHDLNELERGAKRAEEKHPGKFQKFLYCAAKMEPLPQHEEEEERGMLIQNSAVFSQSLSPSSEGMSA